MIAAEAAGVRPVTSPLAVPAAPRAAACRAGCGAEGPAPRRGGDPILALQGTVGNRAVGRLLRPPAPSGPVLGDGGENVGAACTAAVPTLSACDEERDARVRSGPAPVARRMLESAIRVLGGPYSPELSRQLQNSFGAAGPEPVAGLRSRFQRMLELLDGAAYFCPPAESPCCEGLGYGAFVVADRPADVFLCPSFFGEPATARGGQPFTLVHELAHLAGVNEHHVRLQYFGDVDCGPVEGLRDSARGLANTDSYPHFAACADVGLTSPVRRPEAPRPRFRSLIDEIERAHERRTRQRILDSVDALLPRPFGEEEEAGAERRDPVRTGRPLPYREAVEAVERARFFRNSPIVRVEPQLPAATVDNTQTSAQITALARAASGRTSGADNAGLTRARLGMRMSPSTRAGTPSGGRTPFWITDLSVTPLYHSITVYIASEYAPGSCEYRVTLTHENEHVRVDGELLREYAGRMRAALVFADLPTAQNPLSVASAAEGEQAVETLLRGILTPVYDELRARLRQENSALDTPASYRLVHAQCSNW